MNQSMTVPLYLQVKEDIKHSIQTGKYMPKEKIPSETELSAEYSVSRITVRRAVEELCNEGYLIKMQGKGTFVGNPRINRKITNSTRLESFTKTCRDCGMEAGARLLNRQIVPARQDEWEFFGISPQSLLIYIQRVRTADGCPIFLENLFLPYEDYRELMTADLDDTSAFGAIAAVSGREVAETSRRTLEITRASAEQAQVLGVSLGEPMFFMDCYFIDKDRRPVCIGRQYYIGSRYMFAF